MRVKKDSYLSKTGIDYEILEENVESNTISKA